ncbi:hypothetical protein KSP40_PGU005498 [Platanthera guangdongensis]|uniref:Uncharacterized protein n=1 Tax=Platanthera guangdongensis TaxID=2320717 RepID=A0ABR2LCW6_9ASPA
MVVHSWMRNGLINCGGRGARGSLYDPVLGICCHFCRFTALDIYFLYASVENYMLPCHSYCDSRVTMQIISPTIINY